MEIIVDQIIFIVIIGISTIIIRDFLMTFLNVRRFRHMKSWFLWCCYYVLELLAGKHTDNKIVAVVCTITVLSVFSHILFSDSIRRKLLAVLCLCSIFITTDIVVGFLIYYLCDSAGVSEVFQAALSIILKIITVILLKMWMQHKYTGKISLFYWFATIIIPAGNVYVTGNLIALTRKAESKEIMTISLLAVLQIVVMVLLLFTVYKKLLEEVELKRKNSLYLQQIALFKSQKEERETAWKEISKYRHDFTNHLICLNEYFKKEKKDQFQRYMEHLLNTAVYTDTNEISRSGNIVIDAILNFKYAMIHKLNIKFTIDSSIPDTLPFEDIDLSIILGNIIDNAVEAVSQLEADQRLIHLRIIFETGCLMIFLENSYSGSIHKGESGTLLSTKDDTMNHGIGLLSVEKAVGKYDGFLKIRYDCRMFFVKILMYS